MLEVVSGCFGAILAKNLTKLCPDRRVQFMFPASTRRKQRAPECSHPKVHDYKAPAPMKRLVKLPALLEAAPWHLRGALPVGVDDAKTERVVQDFVKARAQGYDPKVDVVVSCMASSDRFKLTMVNMMPCITASRGQSRGFYISTKGDRISMDDMLRCHGIPPKFYDSKSCGVSDRAFGHQLGNCVSCNVFMRVLPRAMYAAGHRAFFAQNCPSPPKKI